VNSIADQTSKHVSIIGGSIAGLTTGLALLKRGWDVQIYEATHGELEHRGAGIITHEALFDALKKLDVTSKDQIGVPIRTRKTFDRNGSIVKTLELEQIATSWGRLYQLLRNQFPSCRYHSHKILTYYEQSESDGLVSAQFADGSTIQSCLLVAADGIRSTVRQLLEPKTKPEYAGYIAWRGLINEQDLSTSERQELFPYFTFCLPEGEQVLSYPIAGEQHQISEGHRRCNVVWYRPAAKESTLQELLTDIDGNNNGESIAPDKVQPEIIAQMQRDAKDRLSPQHTALIGKLAQPFIQPIYDLTTSTMAYGRVALLGDAAFTARPHLGVGITKAAEDSLCLANALDENLSIPDALKHFDNERQSKNRRWVNQSRELGAYLQAQLLSEDERRYAKLHRTTEAVMRETAGHLSEKVK